MMIIIIISKLSLAYHKDPVSLIYLFPFFSSFFFFYHLFLRLFGLFGASSSEKSYSLVTDQHGKKNGTLELSNLSKFP